VTEKDKDGDIIGNYDFGIGISSTSVEECKQHEACVILVLVVKKLGKLGKYGDGGNTRLHQHAYHISVDDDGYSGYLWELIHEATKLGKMFESARGDWREALRTYEAKK
jgi:hypothetical protein